MATPALIRDKVGFQSSIGAVVTNFDINVDFVTKVGNRIIVYGMAGPVTSVTDDRGNAYTVHVPGATGTMFVASAPCVAALQVNDKIHVFRSAGSTPIALVSEWSGVNSFGSASAGATYSTTSAVGGSTTVVDPNELVLGLFRAFFVAGGGGLSEIATPGPGFTNLTGTIRDVGSGASSFSLDHEYRVGPAPGPIEATATVTRASAGGTGLTFTFRPFNPVGAMPLTGSRTESWYTPPKYVDACTGNIALTGSLSELYVPPQSLIRLAREFPPLRHHIVATTPNGLSYRWGHDEPRAENVFNGLRWGSTMPGGYESMDCVLPREPGVIYSDLDRLTTLQVVGAGATVVGEYRLERTPQTSGDQMAISPSAVGWQAHLDDNKGVSIIFIDRELAGWGAMSRQRILNLLASGYNPISNGSVVPDTTTGVPTLDIGFDDPGSWTATTKPIVEPLYDAGPGNSIGRVRANWVIAGATAAADGNWTLACIANVRDTLDGAGNSVGDFFTGSQGASGSIDLITTGLRRFAALQWYYAVGPAGTAGSNNRYGLNVTLVRVLGDHNLTIRGSTPQTEGLFASDMIAYAVVKWAPKLKVLPTSIQATNFIIPQAKFRDTTTVSEIVKQSTRFGLEDWAVWNDKTFYLNPRNGNPMSRQWRARIGPARLEQTGQQMDRLWESILVQYNDVDGTTRVVGPPGSNVDVEDTRLKDLDPTNPANALGIIRRDKLVMGTSTTAGAIEVGRRFLEEQKAIDRSGRASLTGFVEDSHGVLFPYSEVRAGDSIIFVDAADASARRIVKVSHDDATKTASVDLDAPPEGLQAVLERLGVVLAPLGL